MQNEGEDDILSYWREHQKLFPIIASIARSILDIPASNTLVSVYSLRAKILSPTNEQS